MVVLGHRQVVVTFLKDLLSNGTRLTGIARLLLGQYSSAPLREKLTRVVGTVSPKVVRTRLRAVLDVDVAARLADLTVPVLYLRATEDRVVPAGASRLISGILPSARVVEVESPHLLLQVAPRKAAQHVENFLRGVAAG